MGIPVAPKNVFPSNIEGLPTWYQLRITPEGHMARSDKVDILVAFNAATWRDDLKTVRPGGVVIHEEAFSTADTRTDVTYYGVPFAKLAKAKIQSDTLRKQLANMIYVGVVAGVLGIPWEAIEHGVRRQFLSKPKAVQVNLDAIKVGFDYWQDNFSKQDPYRLEPMTGVVEGKVLVEGNQAAAIGALMGGVTVVAAMRVPDRVRRPVPRQRRQREAHLGRPGRGRAGRGRDGDRRRLGGREGDDLDVWAGNLADGRVLRSRLLRRGPGRDLRHPAHRAVDGPPHTHLAGRHRLRVHALPRRHQAPRAAARHGRGVLRVRARRVRPRRPLPDAGLRPLRPRPRHEPLDDTRVQVPGEAVRQGQGAEQGRPGEARRRVGALPRHRRGRGHVPHLARHRPCRRRLLHPRLGAR